MAEFTKLNQTSNSNFNFKPVSDSGLLKSQAPNMDDHTKLKLNSDMNYKPTWGSSSKPEDPELSTPPAVAPPHPSAPLPPPHEEHSTNPPASHKATSTSTCTHAFNHASSSPSLNPASHGSVIGTDRDQYQGQDQDDRRLEQNQHQLQHWVYENRREELTLAEKMERDRKNWTV